MQHDMQTLIVNVFIDIDSRNSNTLLFSDFMICRPISERHNYKSMYIHRKIFLLGLSLSTGQNQGQNSRVAKIGQNKKKIALLLNYTELSQVHILINPRHRYTSGYLTAVECTAYMYFVQV